MARSRVMHFMNQFFAGIGGEAKADEPVNFREGAVGPGKRLQAVLGNSIEIVITVYCGDDYFTNHRDEVLGRVMQIAKDYNVNILVAGPAFASGRYGFTCVEVCHFLTTSLNLDCVAGMHIENPGLIGYKQYKDRRVFIFPAAKDVSGMEDTLSRMAHFVSKLAVGSAIGSASEEGYIPRGIRVIEVVNRTGVERAVEMLLNQHSGRSFTTEIPIESLDEIPVPPPISNLGNACLALVCEPGVVPFGNPDGFKNHRNTQWRKYSIDKMNSMKDAKWEVRHGGFDTSFMSDNPNYGVPLDVSRELERAKVFDRLYPYFYVTGGCSGFISVMERIGREMASDMKAEGVSAALLVST